jgi:hypothetical protein
LYTVPHPAFTPSRTQSPVPLFGDPVKITNCVDDQAVGDLPATGPLALEHVNQSLGPRIARLGRCA